MKKCLLEVLRSGKAKTTLLTHLGAKTTSKALVILRAWGVDALLWMCFAVSNAVKLSGFPGQVAWVRIPVAITAKKRKTLISRNHAKSGRDEMKVGGGCSYHRDWNNLATCNSLETPDAKHQNAQTKSRYKLTKCLLVLVVDQTGRGLVLP